MITLRNCPYTRERWCAAASTGQEPYTLAMMLNDSFPELDDWHIDIVATDIDSGALARAETGVYSQFEVQRGLPVQLLIKHFEQTEEGWRIKDDLRRRIRWKQLNLLHDFTELGVFDVVLCRNVLIYFQGESKQDILNRLAPRTRLDGYLFLGAAETVLGISDAFGRLNECKSAVYRPTSAVSPTSA